ncbi:MAG TPA: VIT1/CCC1 transporter family protein, partial [Acidimicrobiia bacterium]|nr:VIT1/CCC1 transporter family protein [Acidimicrobiia bacterium]
AMGAAVPTRVGAQSEAGEPHAEATELEARITRVVRGAARAAVLGVSDGLVTNICVTLAVAGADASRSAVRLAGFASLIAGALSMAAGEWISVRSQVELFEGILGRLRGLVHRDPELILDQLTDRLEEAGIARETAQRASTELPLDESRFLRFCANTLFGLNPDELGSPMTAALTSLAYFAAGATVPLIPWFITEGTAAKLASVVATAAASLVVGAVVGRSSDRPPLPAAVRQLAIVVAASAVTYGIGNVFGTAVS